MTEKHMGVKDVYVLDSTHHDLCMELVVFVGVEPAEGATAVEFSLFLGISSQSRPDLDCFVRV